MTLRIHKIPIDGVKHALVPFPIDEEVTSSENRKRIIKRCSFCCEDCEGVAKGVLENCNRTTGKGMKTSYWCLCCRQYFCNIPRLQFGARYSCYDLAHTLETWEHPFKPDSTPVNEHNKRLAKRGGLSSAEHVRKKLDLTKYHSTIDDDSASSSADLNDEADFSDDDDNPFF